MNDPHLVPAKFVLEFLQGDDAGGGTVFAVAEIVDGCEHFVGLEIELGSCHVCVADNPELWERFQALMRDALPAYLEAQGGKVHSVQKIEM